MKKKLKKVKKKRKLKKVVKHQIVYGAVSFLVAFLRLIPRRSGIMLMKMCALVFYAASKKHRTNTIRNLTMAFGDEKSEKEIKRIARNVFLHFATAGVDAIRSPVYIKEGIDRYITTKNLHILEKARDDAKGYILLSGHFGNWELMGGWISQKNFRPHIVGASISNPGLNKLILDIRTGAGCIIIPRGNATREVFKVLERGDALALLIDQDTRVKGVFVDFFGMKAHTPVGPAYLAGTFDVPIIPLSMRLKKDLTYELEFFEPITYTDTGNPEKDILITTQECSDIYEQMIRRHPEQWVWMHRRWKKQPGDPVRPRN